MDFVSFETAKKLKEKGYGESWDYVYNDDGGICIPCYNLTDEDTIPMCPAPQIHEVLKWLREEKKLHVSIMTFMFKAGWCYEVVRLGENPTLITTQRSSTNTYEQAAIAGIEYVLDNLI